MRRQMNQRGGTFLGLVLGLVIGLGAALAVAVYVTKVPIPFVNKASSRTSEQDATEVQKNKDWDPNAPLYGKNPAKPATPAPVAVAVPVDKASEPKTGVTQRPVDAPTHSTPKHDPIPAPDPLGDLVKARATAAATKTVAPATSGNTDPFVYFVQVGAFRTPEDAESHRAKLSLAGIETKVSEREQSGRMVYRVRLGPYEKREDADKVKAKMDATGSMETALVRVQR